MLNFELFTYQGSPSIPGDSQLLNSLDFSLIHIITIKLENKENMFYYRQKDQQGLRHRVKKNNFQPLGLWSIGRRLNIIYNDVWKVKKPFSVMIFFSVSMNCDAQYSSRTQSCKKFILVPKCLYFQKKININICQYIQLSSSNLSIRQSQKEYRA